MAQQASTIGDRLWTKSEAAEYLRVTQRTIENWMARGLPHLKLGTRRTRFRKEDIDTFLVTIQG
jgi:excisionase family DNA binding protein